VESVADLVVEILAQVRTGRGIPELDRQLALTAAFVSNPESAHAHR
jgi:hypothetical protein